MDLGLRDKVVIVTSGGVCVGAAICAGLAREGAARRAGARLPTMTFFCKEIPMRFNVGTIDRFLRVAVGLALIAAAWFGAVGSWGWIGLLPLVTGLVGSCPAYLPFGFSTCAAKTRPGGR